MKKKILAGIVSAGLIISMSVPVFAATLPVTIAADYHQSILATGDGKLMRWGWLGTDTETVLRKPAVVEADVKEVSNNNSTEPIMKKSDGSTWTLYPSQSKIFSRLLVNSNGDLFSLEKPEVKLLSGVTEAYVIGNTIAAKTADNTAYFFDDDSQTVKQTVSNVKKLYPGYFNYVIKMDNSLWGWGDVRQDSWISANYKYVNYNIASPVKLMNSVKMISRGINHTAILKTDGSLCAVGWGQNFGKGKKEYTSSVKLDSNVSFVSCQAGCNIVYLKNDGTLWGLGEDDDGVFNTGKATYLNSNGNYVYNISNTPQKIAIGVDSFSVSDTHIMVLKKDGTLWTGGSNHGGAIGDGTSNDRLKLVKIMSGLMTQSATAEPTNSKIYIDGKQVEFEAYCINGNNYFKLRDVALALSGTKAQFEVAWNKERFTIDISDNKAYTTVGGELKSGNGQIKSANLTTSPVNLNGSEVEMTSYNINGNNFFKLRDIGKILGFSVSWDKNLSAIMVDSDATYTEN